MASMAEKILPMDDDVNVLPGHGPVTTVGNERRTNPFLLELQADTGSAPSGLWTPG
jgi:glyoxylase-like metal-dependent hydrolase (beta-lactamase superfamily II)